MTMALHARARRSKEGGMARFRTIQEVCLPTVLPMASNESIKRCQRRNPAQPTLAQSRHMECKSPADLEAPPRAPWAHSRTFTCSLLLSLPLSRFPSPEDLRALSTEYREKTSRKKQKRTVIEDASKNHRSVPTQPSYHLTQAQHQQACVPSLPQPTSSATSSSSSCSLSLWFHLLRKLSASQSG